MPYGHSATRGGSYNRLAEPDWIDPLDTSYSLRGGRWNPPESFPTLYLNRGLRMARLQVRHKLAGQPYGVEDLDESEQHDLVEVDVPERRDWLGCITARALTAVGLPETYPRHRNGRPVARLDCQRIGGRAFDAGRPGIACRSAARGASQSDEELAIFDRGEGAGVRPISRRSFADWFWD